MDIRRRKPDGRVAPTRVQDLLNSTELESMYNVIDSHLEQLRPLKAGLVEQVRRGIKPLYLLDFHELYVYMYPYSQGLLDSTITRYFLENAQVPFFLPDGAHYELALHLCRLSQDVDATPHLLDEESALAEISEFRRITGVVDSWEFEGLQKDRSGSFSEPLSRLVGGMRLHDHAVRRLHSLLENANVLSVADIYPDKVIGIDGKAFEVSRRVLETVRPGRRDSNLADAVNMATVAWMRRHPSPAGYRPYLVTHTPTLIYSKAWDRDSEAQAYGIGPDFLKTHLDAFYAAVVAQHSNNALGQVKLVGTAVEKCDALQRRILEIPGFLAPTRESGRQSLGCLGRLEDSWEHWFAVGEEIKAFQSYFFDVFAETVDRQLAANARQNVTSMEVYGQGATSAARRRLAALQTVESLRSTIRSVLDLSHRKTGDHPRSLIKDAIGSRDYPALNLFSVTSQDSVLKRTGTERFRLLTHDGKLIAQLELYASDYYSFHWPTLVSLRDFAQHVEDAVKRLEDDDAYSVRAAAHPEAEGEFEFDTEGTIIGTESRRLTFPLRWPIEIRSHVSHLAKGEAVSFIRINTRFGDFYVDVFGRGVDEEPIMGVLSHLDATSVLIELFSLTCRHHFWPRILELELRKRLARFRESPL